jgi:hypothetical protein
MSPQRSASNLRNNRVLRTGIATTLNLKGKPLRHSNVKGTSETRGRLAINFRNDAPPQFTTACCSTGSGSEAVAAERQIWQPLKRRAAEQLTKEFRVAVRQNATLSLELPVGQVSEQTSQQDARRLPFTSANCFTNIANAAAAATIDEPSSH